MEAGVGDRGPLYSPTALFFLAFGVEIDKILAANHLFPNIFQLKKSKQHVKELQEQLRKEW